jgi:predicted RNase H-like HicB family nuclease
MTTNDVSTPTGDELLASIGQLTIVYEDAGDGWVTVSLLEVPGAISQGATVAEARANVLEAAKELLRSYVEDGTEPEIRTIVGVEVVRNGGV